MENSTHPVKEAIIKQPKYYYGWIIVSIAALIYFFSGPGQTYSISMFIDYYVVQMGWNRSLVSAIYSFSTLLAGLTLPIIGKNIDRFGHKVMTVFIAFALAGATFWMSFVHLPWMLAIGFFLMRLFGQGSMTLAASTLIPKWFVKRRGFALSLMSLGGVAGSTFIPLINATLIRNYGAIWAWRFWGLMLILVMASVAHFFLYNDPEKKGIGIDEELNSSKHSTLKLTTNISIRDVSFTLQQAMKTKAFWFLLFTVSVPAMINTGLTFHMVSIMQSKLLDLSFTALVLGVTASVQFPFTFIAGWLLDRVPVHKIRAANFGALALVMVFIVWAQSKETLILYACFHGIFAAFDSVSNGVIWPNYFGIKYLGSIRSISMMSMVIGSALGPLPFGLAFDLFGGYQEIIILMLIFPILSVILSLLSPPPKALNTSQN